jgi:hypothetical protein
VALYESITQENRGVLRPNAFLAIVILADRDDCSGETDADLFTDGVAFPQTDPLLRCSVEGHMCDGKRPPVDAFSAPLSTCRAAERGRLIGVAEMLRSIRDLKSRPDQQIVMATIAGWPDDQTGVTYGYARGGDGVLAEQPLCNTVNGGARAGLRLQAATAQFERGAMHDVCASDLSPTMKAIGSKLYGHLTGLCLTQPPLDGDPAAAGLQPQCQAVLAQPAADTLEKMAIPWCSEGGPRPCLLLMEEASCAGGFKGKIDVGAAPPPPGTQVHLSCAVAIETAAPGPAPEPCRPPCQPRKALGQTCSLAARESGQSQASYRSDAPECASGLCLKPARDIAVARVVDTQATCTRTCNADIDCADAELRDRANPADKRCVAGYTCAVPFEVGPLCCRKLCVCKEFLPASGAPVPASCGSAGSSCPNRL